MDKIVKENIVHVPGRFYIVTPSGEAELLYLIDKKTNTISMYHTFVPTSERGRGIAELMAFAAFDFAKKNKLLVKPDCEYITYFVEKHKELKKIVFYD